MLLAENLDRVYGEITGYLIQIKKYLKTRFLIKAEKSLKQISYQK